MAFNGNQNDLKFGYSGYAFSDNTDIVSRSDSTVLTLGTSSSQTRTV